jgi:FKBP-type peptidyl-prolyl cis-trans isomerase SlyD
MEHKLLAVHYQLYAIENGEKTLIEQTSPEHPFQFISGFGVSLEALEKQVLYLGKGTKFDFTLAPADAFGEYDEEGVHKLPRESFAINGHFDHENIFEGAVITLMDADERRFMARVEKVEEDGVTVDTNHPLAGQQLQFTGLVLENRDATKEEIQHMLNHLSGEGCGCGCDDCEGGCGGHEHKHNHEEGCGCGCGHCH